jgi:hypothetical protein
MNDIVGYTWDQIQAAQQGKPFRQLVTGAANSDLTDDRIKADIALLNELGLNGLESKQFYGVIDRLNRIGALAEPTQ